MRHLILILAALTLALPAWADDAAPKKKPPQKKKESAAVIMQKTDDGMIGKIGQDKVMIYDDKQGTRITKVGDKSLICHRTEDGLTICK